MSRSTVPPGLQRGWFLRFNHTFRDAHNRLYSPHALYSYAHSLVKRLIWTGKGEPGGHACESPTSERPRQLTTVAILRMLRWALRLVVVSRSESVETVLNGDLFIDFRCSFDIHFPLVAVSLSASFA